MTVSVPGELIPLLNARKAEEHIPSDSKFFLSLLLFDLMARCPHAVTAKLVSEPEAVFYRMVAEIIENFPSARTNTSKWVAARLKKIQAEEASKKQSAGDPEI